MRRLSWEPGDDQYENVLGADIKVEIRRASRVKMCSECPSTRAFDWIYPPDLMTGAYLQAQDQVINPLHTMDGLSLSRMRCRQMQGCSKRRLQITGHYVYYRRNASCYPQINDLEDYFHPSSLFIASRSDCSTRGDRLGIWRLSGESRLRIPAGSAMWFEVDRATNHDLAQRIDSQQDIGRSIPSRTDALATLRSSNTCAGLCDNLL